MALRELIKVVVETHDAMNATVAKFRDYNGKVANVNREVNAQVEGNRDLGLLNKIRAIKNTEENNAKIQRLVPPAEFQI